MSSEPSGAHAREERSSAIHASMLLSVSVNSTEARRNFFICATGPPSVSNRLATSRLPCVTRSRMRCTSSWNRRTSRSMPSTCANKSKPAVSSNGSRFSGTADASDRSEQLRTCGAVYTQAPTRLEAETRFDDKRRNTLLLDGQMDVSRRRFRIESIAWDVENVAAKLMRRPFDLLEHYARFRAFGVSLARHERACGSPEAGRWRVEW
jgi:hypothetical protein